MYLHASMLQGLISFCNASWPTPKATGQVILLYVVLYSVNSWYISRKNRLVKNWYSFLGYEYCFLDAVVNRLVALIKA